MGDPFDLERFVAAQDPVFDTIVEELARGRKESHWMWFVFPQIAGLGTSPLSRQFAIASLDEAEAYLAHPLLGPRLRRCTALVLATEGRSVSEIFFSPDDLKFHSSMTLFARASPEDPLFLEALAHFFRGEEDPQTLVRLGAS